MGVCNIDTVLREKAWDIEAKAAAVKLTGPSKTVAKARKEIIDYINELGSEMLYAMGDGLPTPMDIAEGIKIRYNMRHVRELSDNTLGVNKWRAQGLSNLIKGLKKSREKVVKSGKMRGLDKGFLNPEVTALKSESFGVLFKVIRAGKMLSDNIRQWQNRFSKDIEAVDKKLKDKLEISYQEVQYDRNGQEKKVGQGIITLNNSALDGIDWYIKVRGKGTPIKIFKENPTHYLIGYKSEDPTDTITRTKWISKKKVNIPEEALQTAIVEKLQYEFMNDILHGQIKHVTYAALPFKKDGTVDKNHEDYKKILEARMRDYKYKKDGQVSTEFLFKTEKINGETVKIRYMLVKQKNSERYNAYIVSYKISENDWIRTDENIIPKEYQKHFAKLFPAGYYKAKGETFGGNIIQTNENRRTFIEGTSTRAFIDYNLMNGENTEKDIKEGKLQKPPPLLDYSGTAIAKDAQTGVRVFEYVTGQYRETFSKIFDRLKKEVKKEATRRAQVHNRITKHLQKTINPDTGEVYTKDERDAFLKNLYKIADIESDTWIDKRTGSIRTPNSLLRRKTENYGPVMWTNRNLHHMIDQRIHQLIERIQEESDPDKRGELEKALLDMREIQASTAGLSHEELQDGDKIGKIRDAVRNVYSKHRITWTSYLLRRKDSQVTKDYIHQTFRNLESNKLVTQLLESVYQTLRIENSIPKDGIDYMVNQVKVALGNPDTKAGLGKWVSNQGIAEIVNELNRLPFVKGIEWDAQRAERLLLTVNAVFSSRFLGATGAAGNRTQILNNIIHHGVRTWRKAGRIIKSENSEWEDAINLSGVDNMVSIFNDMMMQGGALRATEYMFNPFVSPVTQSLAGVPFPSIPNVSQLIILLRKGRGKFREHHEFHLDRALLNTAKRNALAANDAEYAARLEQQISKLEETGTLDESSMTPKDLERLKEKRALYFDIMTEEKNESSEKILRARYKKLMGKISEDKLKAMVSWKLTYWWKGWGEQAFTFTEGERAMRRKTAVMALIDADSAGLLGSGENRHSSPEAIRIARNAVYQTMFGMSPVHLGTAFHGLGRVFGQYKAYPLQQALHDYDIWKSFSDESENVLQHIPRLVKELHRGGKRIGHRMIGNTEKGKYDPTDESTDHEAWAVMRLISTRVMASVISTIIAVVPFANSIINGPLRWVTKHQLRSAENPMFGIPMRLLTRWLIYAMALDDEEEKDEKVKKDILDRLTYLFLPVFFLALRRDFKEVKTLFQEEETGKISL